MRQYILHETRDIYSRSRVICVTYESCFIYFTHTTLHVRSFDC